MGNHPLFIPFYGLNSGWWILWPEFRLVNYVENLWKFIHMGCGGIMREKIRDKNLVRQGFFIWEWGWTPPEIRSSIRGCVSKPSIVNVSGVNTQLPAILMWTLGYIQGFDPKPHGKKGNKRNIWCSFHDDQMTRIAPQTAPQIPPPKSKKAGGDRRRGDFGWSEDDEFIPWAFDSCPLYRI